MKLRELKEQAVKELTEAGIELPYLEVQVIFEHFLHLSKAQQILRSDSACRLPDKPRSFPHGERNV